MMSNGGWYGTQEEWSRLESPLTELDSAISAFAAEHPVTISKSYKDWPERSLKWGENPSCLMQLYLADADALTWHLWLCCSQDRERDQFWRQERIVDGEPVSSFAPHFSRLLKEGYLRLEAWKAAPEQLEFVTRIAALPGEPD
jgi:hypothetical protein